MSPKFTYGLRRLLLSSSAGAIATLALSASTVSAQQAADSDEIEQIVVTGSRIARPEFQASSPVTAVGSDIIMSSGSTNLERLLNELPQVTPDATASTNNGSDGGIATINLRDLGANRTLVLVNGRRFVSSNNNGVVDLNNIPSALVERVDVVTGGASAVYGSDAIGGVVNFLLKDNFEGMELGGQYRVTEKGDGEIYDIDLTVGGNFADDRGNAVLHTSYANRRALRAAEREKTATALGDFGAEDGLFPLGSSRIPGGTILVPSVLPDGTQVSSVKFLPDGTPIDRAGETFNFQPENFIQTPQERWIINGLAHYDISDSITAYSELFYSNNRIVTQLAPDANDIPEPPNQLLVTIANPLFNSALRTFLTENFDEDGDGVASIPAFRRRMTENGPRLTDFEHDAFRVMTGLRGDIADLGINYDIYYSHARTNRTEVLERFTSDIRIGQALLLEEIPGSPGEYQCAAASARSQGCVPISIFGDGALSPEGAAFISPTAVVKRSTEQDIISGSIGGELMDLGLGGAPIGYAFGTEYRRESSNNQPDAIVQSGELGPGNDEAPTRGNYDVYELFGEVVVPILDNLNVEAAFRYSDYSTVGTVWTYKAGGQYEPIDGFRLRALYQRAVRAPNIAELFQGRSAGADDFEDPCAARNLPSPQLQQFCIAQGVPAALLPTFEGDSAGQATTIFGGNPDLEEERADTYTVGFVFTPDYIPGLSATLDYYDIDLSNAIDDLDAATTSTLCFASLDLNSDACQAITRDPANGIVTQIRALRANLASEKRKGIDWQINYNFDLDFGLFETGTSVVLQNVGNFTFTNESTPLEDSDPIDCNGKFGEGCIGLGNNISPEWRTTFSAAFLNGPLTWRNQVRIIGSLSNTSEGLFIDKISTKVYYDLSLSYDITENFFLTAGIDNVLDKGIVLLADNGPDANTDASLFDVFGRTYFFSLRVRY